MFLRLTFPFPPIPIPAIFSRSLGGICPSPETAILGTTEKARPVALMFFTKSLRLITFILNGYGIVIINPN
jgi:hypothetical protein